MLNPEISHKVRNYLFRNKELHIPGLGTLKSESVNQYLSLNETIIHPPFQKVRFWESRIGQKRNSLFKDYYLNKKLNKILKSKFKAVVNEVLNFGYAEINGIGRFSRDNNGTLTYSADKLFNADIKYLPIIDVSKFQTVKQPTSVSLTNGLVSFKKNNRTKGKTQSGTFNSELKSNKSIPEIMPYINAPRKKKSIFKTPWLSNFFLGSVILVTSMIFFFECNGQTNEIIQLSNSLKDSLTFIGFII